MPSERALGVAVVGTGKMGADHVRRLRHRISGARVTAVVDIEAERAKTLADAIEGCAAYTEPAAAMAARDVDAVLIASPGPAHEAALLEALDRDLPVLCEKPLTPTRPPRCASLRQSRSSDTAASKWASCGGTTPST